MIEGAEIRTTLLDGDFISLSKIEKQDDNAYLIRLGAIAGLTSLSLMFSSILPSGVKSLTYLTSVAVASIGIGYELSESTINRRKYRESISQARKLNLQESFRQNQEFNRLVTTYAYYNQVLQFAGMLPDAQRNRLLKERKLNDISPWQQQSGGSPLLPPGGYNAVLPSSPDAPQVNPLDAAYELYNQLNLVGGVFKPVFFVGAQGDGKTVSAQFFLWCKFVSILKEEKPVPFLMVFDPHFNVSIDDEWQTNWIGIPKLESCPTKPETGVYVGTKCEELINFLRVIETEIDRRLTGQHPNTTPIIFVLEELDSMMKTVAVKDRNTMHGEVNRILGRVAFESRKVNITYIGLAHTFVQSKSFIDREVLGNAVCCMGRSLINDSTQHASIPDDISQDGMNKQKEAIAVGQTFIGMSTTNPVVPYIPPSPISPKQMAESIVLNSKPEKSAEQIRARNAFEQCRAILLDPESNNLSDQELAELFAEYSGMSVDDVYSKIDAIRHVLMMSEENFNSRMEQL